jgi:hypothetical protein
MISISTFLPKYKAFFAFLAVSVCAQLAFVDIAYAHGKLSQSQKKALSEYGTGMTGLTAVFGGGAVVLAFFGPVGLAAAGVLTVAGIATGYGAYRADKLAGDPPDYNFKVIAGPTVGILPPLIPGNGIPLGLAVAANGLANNAAQISAYAAVLLTTKERQRAAYLSGDTYWLKRQAAAAARYQQQLAFHVAQGVTLLAEFSSALSAAGFDVTVTTADVSAFQSEIATNGFSAEAIAALEQLGATASEISAIANAIANHPVNINTGLISTLLVTPEFTAATKELVLQLDASCASTNFAMASFGARDGQARYSLDGDVNADGIVDLVDLPSPIAKLCGVDLGANFVPFLK